MSFVCVIVFFSCNTNNEEREGNCFLQAFFKEQSRELANENRALQKTMYYDGEMNDSLLAKPIWKKEFKLFLENLPDSTELMNKFTRDYQVDGEKEREQFVKKEDEGNSETIELVYINKELISVRMHLLTTDKLSSQELAMSYNTGKSIGAKGKHSLLRGKHKEFEVFGEIK